MTENLRMALWVLKYRLTQRLWPITDEQVKATLNGEPFHGTYTFTHTVNGTGTLEAAIDPDLIETSHDGLFVVTSIIERRLLGRWHPQRSRCVVEIFKLNKEKAIRQDQSRRTP